MQTYADIVAGKATEDDITSATLVTHVDPLLDSPLTEASQELEMNDAGNIESKHTP